MNRRHFLATLAALGAYATCAAQSAAAADLKGDIAILRQALALHPGLYRYASPREVEARLDRLERAFVAAPTSAQRYLVLSRFLATILCGHSYANFFNQNKAVVADLFAGRTRLPFLFRWIDDRMIVIGDPGGHGLAPGTEVTSVNGVRAARMLASLMPYARADGHNDAKRVSLLGVSGGDTIETFDVFHGLVYGAPAGGVHRLALRTPDGHEHTRELPAIDLAARQAQMTPRDYRGDQPVWTWTMRPDGIALLTMPGWALYDSTWDWRRWLDDRLASLGGTKGLIIDLRDNEGGQDCGDPILARLIDRPLVEEGAERRVRFTRTPASIDRHLDTWDDSFRTLGIGAEPIGGGFLRLAGERGSDVIQPIAPRLTLPVAALIGPVNSSATFQFASKAKLSGRIRLFGEPTGGNRRGINGGCFFFVRLPASGLEFDLPLIGYFPPGSPPDAGIVPNVRAAATAADIGAGFDRPISAAAGWIVGHG